MGEKLKSLRNTLFIANFGTYEILGVKSLCKATAIEPIFKELESLNVHTENFYFDVRTLGKIMETCVMSFIGLVPV